MSDGSITVISDERVPKGKIALLRNMKPVWFCSMSDPFEDVEFDCVIISPPDYDRVQAILKEIRTIE